MSSHLSPSRSTFFGGATILAAGIAIVKIIGMLYKIPLVSVIGDAGYADFSNAYNIYSVLLTISTAGLPVALSKMVSEANTMGRRDQVHKVFRVALGAFLALGLISFFIMYFGAARLAGLMGDSMAADSIRVLSPAVVCVGCLAAFRGYAQGHGNMVPTAASQVIEALCKLVIGLALAVYLMGLGRPEHEGAAGAIAGVTVGTILALGYMVVSFALQRRREDPCLDRSTDSAGGILKTLLTIAIPITLTSSMVGIVTVIDSALVQSQLQKALLTVPDSWALYEDFLDFGPLSAALTGGADSAAALTAAEEASRSLYGNYAGTLTIYNLPSSLMVAITASVIPAISAALARRSRKSARRIAAASLRMCAIAALPMGVGLLVLGEPIIRLLFRSLDPALAGALLSTLGVASIFVCVMMVCNSILQAYGFINLPVVIMLLGGVVKIAVNYNLVVMPQVGIYGAPMGNVLCFGLVCVLDLIVVSRVIPGFPGLFSLFGKPVLAAAVMGGAVWGCYGLTSRLIESNTVCTLLSICVGGAVYLALIVLLRALTRDELALMPKGDKIARLLRLD